MLYYLQSKPSPSGFSPDVQGLSVIRTFPQIDATPQRTSLDLPTKMQYKETPLANRAASEFPFSESPNISTNIRPGPSGTRR